MALTAVEDNTENMIIVIPRANGLVGQQELEGLERVLGQTKVLLLQLEIPFFFEPFPDTAVDTASNGDPFNGALKVALSEGLPIEEALQ